MAPPVESKAMSEPSDDRRVDVVLYPSGTVKAVPAGKGADIVRSYHDRRGEHRPLRRVLLAVVSLLVLAYSLLVVRNLLLGLGVVGVLWGAFWLVPRLLDSDARLLDADVALRDAREQWDAEPVSELASTEGAPGARGSERAREHAFE